MVCSYNSKRCFIVIFNSQAYIEPIVGKPLPLLLPSQRAGKGACDITGRGPNPNLLAILYFSLITLTQFILKPSVSNKYSGMIIM